jgi:putative transposase
MATKALRSDRSAFFAGFDRWRELRLKIVSDHQCVSGQFIHLAARIPLPSGGGGSAALSLVDAVNISSYIERMKLVANIKLQPTPEQFQQLKETLERCNAACDYLSARGFEAGILRTFDLHKLGYADIRERFGLAAQVAVRCIAKTADAYKLDKKVQRTFRKHAAQPYDDRIVSFKPRDIVSIWTLAGRIKVKSVMGKRQRDLLAFRKGEVDLMFVRGAFYLACVCDIDEADPILTTKVLGVDLGIVNIFDDVFGN